MLNARLPEIMDSTMLVAWRSCPQRFLLSYCANLATVEESVDLHFGAAIAKGLEAARKAYYLHGQPAREAETLGINAACAAYGDFEPPEKSAKTWANVLVTMTEYFRQWPLDSDPVRPHEGGIEFSFAWPVPEALRPDGSPWLYGGRLDMLAELGGLLYVEDEKTTGQSFSSSWPEQFDIRNQFMGYVWGAQYAGYDCHKALVRGISVLKTKVTFLSAFADFPPYMIQRWYAQLVRDLNRITAMWQELEATGMLEAFDRNFGDACFSWNRPCAFKLACTGSDPLAWLTGSGYKTRVWSPLRQNPEEDKPEDRPA